MAISGRLAAICMFMGSFRVRPVTAVAGRQDRQPGGDNTLGRRVDVLLRPKPLDMARRPRPNGQVRARRQARPSAVEPAKARPPRLPSPAKGSVAYSKSGLSHPRTRCTRRPPASSRRGLFAFQFMHSPPREGYSPSPGDWFRRRSPAR